eukprot:gene26952-48418_t
MWVTGSSGSGRASIHPAAWLIFTPSTSSTSREPISMSERMTMPFCSHG